MSSENPKRKTFTSTAVKAKYNKKAYRQFSARIRPDLADRLNAYTEREGISKPEFLARALEVLEK